MLQSYSTLRLLVVYAFLCQLVNSGELTSVEKQTSQASEASEASESRIYDFKRIHGGGCPYTASWLADVNLFRRVVWYLDSTKMEAASFQIFDKSSLKFQVSDPDAYYVHHMSRYEHSIHRKRGYAVAQNQTLILSSAAVLGECDNLVINPSREYLALIPFYGGLPPDLTADMKVKSIGQGNSLVSASTKAIQCMATLCSTLKYYGHTVIGVVRDDDRDLIIQALDSMHPAIRARTQIVQLSMPKPANLPFHLLAWAQNYVKKHNCDMLTPENQQNNANNGNNVNNGNDANNGIIENKERKEKKEKNGVRKSRNGTVIMNTNDLANSKKFKNEIESQKSDFRLLRETDKSSYYDYFKDAFSGEILTKMSRFVSSVMNREVGDDVEVSGSGVSGSGVSGVSGMSGVSGDNRNTESGGNNNNNSSGNSSSSSSSGSSNNSSSSSGSSSSVITSIDKVITSNNNDMKGDIKIVTDNNNIINNLNNLNNINNINSNDTTPIFISTDNSFIKSKGGKNENKKSSDGNKKDNKKGDVKKNRKNVGTAPAAATTDAKVVGTAAVASAVGDQSTAAPVVGVTTTAAAAAAGTTPAVTATVTATTIAATTVKTTTNNTNPTLTMTSTLPIPPTTTTTTTTPTTTTPPATTPTNNNNIIRIYNTILLDTDPPNQQSQNTYERYNTNHSSMDICGDKGVARPVGTPINVTYFRPSQLHLDNQRDNQRNMRNRRLQNKNNGIAANQNNEINEKNVRNEKNVQINQMKKIEKISKRHGMKETDEDDTDKAENTEVSVKGNMDIQTKGNRKKRKNVKNGSNGSNGGNGGNGGNELIMDGSKGGSRSGQSMVKRKVPIKFVYYTECDQIVRYDSMGTFRAFSAALNESCFFVGRRREKVESSDASDYMGGLDQWRECGTAGYSMAWPGEKVVRQHS